MLVHNHNVSIISKLIVVITVNHLAPIRSMCSFLIIQICQTS